MDPERNHIHEQIEDARGRVAEDVQTIGDGLNVVDRTKEAISERVDGVKSAIGEKVSATKSAVGGAAKRTAGAVSDRPLLMLLGGAAVGFLAGALFPVSRFEAEHVGPVAEDLTGKVKSAGAEAVRRGGTVIRETVQAGRDAAASSLKEQVHEFS